MQMLPNKLAMIHSSDKTFHESYKEGDDLLNFTHPFRAVLCGPPHSGKSLCIKNLIIRQNPMFEKIMVLHCDENASEYDDVGAEILTEIPEPNEFDGAEKTLVVIDDAEVNKLSKQQYRCLDRLVGYVSTHKNVSVCIASQDSFSIPPIARKCANLYILWKPRDIDSLKTIGRRTGIKSDEFKKLFDEHIVNHYDSIWIDLTHNSPAPLRKNGYELINFVK